MQITRIETIFGSSKFFIFFKKEVFTLIEKFIAETMCNLSSPNIMFKFNHLDTIKVNFYRDYAKLVAPIQ